MSRDNSAQEKTRAYEHPDSLNVVPFPKAGGYVQLFRSDMYDPVTSMGQPVKPHNPDKPASSRFEAWCWLLGEAAWRPRDVSNRGTIITLEINQLMASHKFLAEKWNWSEKQVRGWLDRLESRGKLRKHVAPNPGKQRGNLVQILTVCAGGEIVAPRPRSGQESRPVTGKWTASQGQESKKGSTEALKELKETPCSPPAGDSGGLDRSSSGRAEPAPRRRAQSKNFGFLGKVGDRSIMPDDGEDILEAARRLESSTAAKHVRQAVRNADEKFAEKKPSAPSIMTWCIEEARRLAAWERLGIEHRFKGLPKPYWYRDNPAAVAAMSEDDWERIIEQVGPEWSEEYCGPKPGDEDCLIPQPLIDRHRCKSHVPEKDWWLKYTAKQISGFSDEFWTGYVRRFAKTSWRADFLGPPPGASGCLVPCRVIRDENLQRFGTQPNA